MPRTVTIHAATNGLIGDETFEAWLKHETDAWALVDAGAVDQVAGSQTFVFPGLVDGADYSLQLRMKRAGRYRIGYLSADPETWPAGSRLDFTVGSLIGIGAPTLTAVDDWVRTDAVHSKFVVHITPDDVSQDLELVRDGAVIHTFTAPLTDPIVYDDIDPVLAVDHVYKARHVAGTLGGPFSAEILKYAGPGPVAGLVQVPPLAINNEYTVEWTDDARTYRLEDDYPDGTYRDLSGPVTGGSFLETHDASPAGTSGIANFFARIRAEVTTFGVTDLSKWSSTGITMHYNDLA
jgi:hypothetical protein